MLCKTKRDWVYHVHVEGRTLEGQLSNTTHNNAMAMIEKWYPKAVFIKVMPTTMIKGETKNLPVAVSNVTRVTKVEPEPVEVGNIGDVLESTLDIHYMTIAIKQKEA